MELGNIVFGNSRGCYSIPREGVWEFHLERLMYAMGEEPSSYGVDFENDIFCMMPYYWGDCECGYEEKEHEWCEANRHLENCYRSTEERVKIKAGWTKDKYWLERPKKYSYDQANAIEKKIRMKLCQAYNIPWNDGKGCAVHCTCDYKERWIKFLESNSHDKECRITKPNFLYKPTGFEIQWYKYFLRDSYKNQDISTEEFITIIDDCIESIKVKE